jgi:hypothetical protein
MIKRAGVKLMLYEYVQDELSPAERLEVEAHLADCKKCDAQLRSLRDVLTLLPRPETQASEGRSEEFWNLFASKVEQKLAQQEREHRRPWADALDWIEELLLLRPKYTYTMAGTLAVLVVAFAFLTFLPQKSHDISSALNGNSKQLEHVANPIAPGSESEFTFPNERVSQYFRKSKTLLVGLANLRIEQDEPLDFTTERRVSRDLIREARYLKQQPIDPRSRELMNNLERILIELENIEEKDDLPNVEIIRGGIHQENLLFRIRMAEAMYDSTRFLTARDNQ